MNRMNYSERGLMMMDRRNLNRDKLGGDLKIDY